MASTGETRIVEHGNPPFLLIRPARRGQRPEDGVSSQALEGPRHQLTPPSTSSAKIAFIFFSDGITQAGTGESQTPCGWGLENVDQFVREQISENPSISARELSRLLVAKAVEIDGLTAKDDITCGVVYFRSPRQLLVLTGPPFNRSHDQQLAIDGRQHSWPQSHLRRNHRQHHFQAAGSRNSERRRTDARCENSALRQDGRASSW